MSGETTSFLWPRDSRSFLVQRNVNGRDYNTASAPHTPQCTHKSEATEGNNNALVTSSVPLAEGPSSSAFTRDLLLQPEEYLCQTHNLSALEAQARLASIAQRYSPLQTMQSVYDRFFAHRHFNADNSVAEQSLRCNAEDAVATGVAALDAALMGGLRRGFLTELTGTSGCGKTVLALNWAVHAILSNNSNVQEEREVLWLHSSPHAPHPQRMAMICEAQLSRRALGPTTNPASPSSLSLSSSQQPQSSVRLQASLPRSTGITTMTQEEMNATCNVEDHFYMLPVTDLDTLLTQTCAEVEAFLQSRCISHSGVDGKEVTSMQNDSDVTHTAVAMNSAHHHARGPHGSCGVQLLVINSLTELVRRSYGGVETDTLARQTALATFTARLKRWAEQYNIAVLLLTEKSSSTYGEDARRAGPLPGMNAVGNESEGDDEDEQPVQEEEEQAGEFGRLFYHAVNVRLRLAECYYWPTGTLQRRLSILKSPVCPCMHFLLLRDGEMGVRDARVEPGGCRAVCEDVYASVDVIDYIGVPTFVFA